MPAAPRLADLAGRYPLPNLIEVIETVDPEDPAAVVNAVNALEEERAPHGEREEDRWITQRLYGTRVLHRDDKFVGDCVECRPVLLAIPTCHMLAKY